LAGEFEGFLVGLKAKSPSMVTASVMKGKKTKGRLGDSGEEHSGWRMEIRGQRSEVAKLYRQGALQQPIPENHAIK
jgi:hypothetical protein